MLSKHCYGHSLPCFNHHRTFKTFTVNTLFQNLSTASLNLPENEGGAKRPAVKILAVKLNYNDLVSKSSEELEHIFNTFICWGMEGGPTEENVLAAKLYQQLDVSSIFSELLRRMSNYVDSQVQDESARAFYKSNYGAMALFSGCDFKIYNCQFVIPDEPTIEAFLEKNGDFKQIGDTTAIPIFFDAVEQLPIFQVISFNEYKTATPQPIEDEFEAKAFSAFDFNFDQIRDQFETPGGLYPLDCSPITGLPFLDKIDVQGRSVSRGEIEIANITKLIEILVHISKTGGVFSSIPLLCFTLGIPKEYVPRIVILTTFFMDFFEETNRRPNIGDPAQMLRELFNLDR